ncbi:MAG: helix-turn-helix transcriptional regulator [Oscillospiraceae bacterium]|nr:helix-turn-helix transcriptional regulator [Oscillospiraceae bacterium]
MKNLKTLRLKNEYSQSQLAGLMEVGASVVCRWEKGLTAPALPQVIRLCRLLHCSPLELYSDQPSPSDGTAPIPVFEEDVVTIQYFPLNGEKTADFGIILSENMADRLFAGDICYFRISSHGQTGSIVLTSDGHDVCTKVYDETVQNVIAVCISVHCTV